MIQRIQLKRTKGWKLPENTIIVSRPSKFGNPFQLTENNGIEYYLKRTWRPWSISSIFSIEDILYLYTHWILRSEFILKHLPPAPDIEELRGKNLACWCPLDQPCHVDVLLELLYGQDKLPEPEQISVIKIDITNYVPIENQVTGLKTDNEIIARLDMDRQAIERLHYRQVLNDKRTVKAYKKVASELIKHLISMNGTIPVKINYHL